MPSNSSSPPFPLLFVIAGHVADGRQLYVSIGSIYAMSCKDHLQNHLPYKTFEKSSKSLGRERKLANGYPSKLSIAESPPDVTLNDYKRANFTIRKTL